MKINSNFLRKHYEGYSSSLAVSMFYFLRTQYEKSYFLRTQYEGPSSPLTVSVSFLLLESACLSSAESCRIVIFPFSWLTTRCWRLPWGGERQHIATQRSMSPPP